MTRDDVAGRLVVGLSGPVLTDLEAAWLRRYRPAGVILFARNCLDLDQLAGLGAVLHGVVPGLEIVVDHEGGPVSQLARALGRPPSAWTLGQLDDPDLTARVHAETARRLRRAGIDRVLGPVADVLVEPRNPVIGARAFGAEVDRVTRHVAAAVAGLRGEGVSVCLKHWPGHGGGTADTHLTADGAGAGALPAPFIAGLAAGADAIMVGHVGVEPAGLPATLDAAFLAASRRDLGRAGTKPLWYADDITMGALRPAMASAGVSAGDGAGEGLAAPETLPTAWLERLAGAGCDRLLIRGLPLAALPPPPAAPVPALPPPGPPSSVPPTWGANAAAYDEARRRAWAEAGHGFGDRQADLLWWDLTSGDRWEVAGGDLGSARARLGPVLATRFARVAGPGPDTAGSRAFTRLLVTSHRPLPEPLGLSPHLAEGGICLVMGHPSLAASLTSYLGAGWRVAALFDVSAEDLFRVAGSA